MRGRNRPKGPNPLTRSYESNGPDVKIRGTAQHIADKYAQLARDALASGDPVAAENYFQHGEHYFRIITGAQEPNRPQASQGYARHAFEDEDEGDDENDVQGRNGSGQHEREHGRQGFGGQGFGNDEYGDPGQQPQPFERHDYEARQNRGNDRYDRQDRGQDRGDRQDRNDRRDRFQNRNDRPQRFDNNRQDYGRGDFRQDQNRQDQGRQDQGRQDQGRQDQNRQDQPRQDYGRPDYGRQDASRQDQPRFENGRGGPSRQDGNRDDGFRRDRRREEAQRDVPDEAPGLPAFLMTATRNPPPAEANAEQPSRAATEREPAQDREAAAVPPDGEEGAPAPKPRRRRARYKGGEAPAAEGTNEPADATSGE